MDDDVSIDELREAVEHMHGVPARFAQAAPIAVREDDLLGRPLALVVALALVSLLPFVFMSVTSFVRTDPRTGVDRRCVLR
jgi:hypothetical protein